MIRKLLLLLLLYEASSTAFGQLPPVPEKPAADVAHKPRLFVGLRTLELGTVLEGDIVPMSWLLENYGSADLVIEATKSSCGCAIVKLREEEKIIPSGGSLALKTEFNSTRRRGKQTKSVTVLSNDPAEPKLKLQFTAKVELLFEMVPSPVVNLRNVQRGVPASKTIDITLGPGRKLLEVLDVQVRDDELLQAVIQPFQSKTGTSGQQLKLTVAEDAPLGTLMTSAAIKLKVDGIERERTVLIRGEVVGDLTWLPKVVDATGQPSVRGKRLAPVTLRSTDKMPFDVLEVSAGGLLDVTSEPAGNASQRSQYTFHMTVREDAPSGPFGTMLHVRTTCLDQPLINVPIFGIVATPITVDPPIVLLRQDGTAVGTQRRVKLQTSPRLSLDVFEVDCSSKAVIAEVHEHPSSRHHHIRFLDVHLAGKLSEGTHETVITLRTSIEGAETLTIPVTIQVPGL